ncbi:MAG: hypothetical protein ABI690_15315 [Chloroflexota bacterium]
MLPVYRPLLETPFRQPRLYLGQAFACCPSYLRPVSSTHAAFQETPCASAHVRHPRVYVGLTFANDNFAYLSSSYTPYQRQSGVISVPANSFVDVSLRFSASTTKPPTVLENSRNIRKKWTFL